MFKKEVVYMFRILVLWDSRDALIQFIDELDAVLCLNKTEPTFIQLDSEHVPLPEKIKPKIKTLLKQAFYILP
ncbi:hypothetical protein [Marinomonas flavescens]|uniref:hypothetical protein n=1 Tax=Marinomonas flavescens TaxID=2529379 RepID=UPI001056A517|nr:hypothetical protein [Marinomonas flavescens]